MNKKGCGTLHTCENSELHLARMLIRLKLINIPNKQEADDLLKDAKMPRYERGGASRFEEMAQAIFADRARTPELEEFLLRRGRQVREDSTQLSLLRGAFRCICEAATAGNVELSIGVPDRVSEVPCGLLTADEDLMLATVV